MPAIDFYFDFISPYGYLGAVGAAGVAARTGRRLRWRPMLLGISVLKVMGLKAAPDIPLKGDYAAHDWPRCARLMEIPHAPDAPVRFASLTAMRAFHWLDRSDPDLAADFGQAIFRAHWGEGRDMSSLQAICEEACGLGVDPDALSAAVSGMEVKEGLRAAVEESLALGVFGCPSFIVDGELFWGADRLDQVERWIVSGGW